MTKDLTSFPHSLRYKCSSCEEVHAGLPDLSYLSPAHWNDALNPETSFLTSDLCVCEGQDFFLRCLLAIPICETTERMGWGVWSSVSQANFKAYADGATFPGPVFGWFSNSLPGYDETLNLKCKLIAQSSGLRPLIELEPTDHQLSVDQRRGVSVARTLELIEFSGNRILSV